MPTPPDANRRHGPFHAEIEALPGSLRGQVIGGRLVVTPHPSSQHLRAVSAIDRALGARFDDGDDRPNAWWILPAPTLSLTMDPDFDPVVPDLAGWRRAGMPVLLDTAAFTQAPDWCCEVLSSHMGVDVGREKLPLYARAGVSFVWLVDPDAQTLQAFVRDGAEFREVGVWRDDARVHAPPFEAEAIDLARLWVRGS